MSDDFQSTPPAPVAPPPASGDAPSDTGKILAALGYPTGIAALIGLLTEPYKEEKFVRFHAIQALGLIVVLVGASILLGILRFLPGIDFIAAVLRTPLYLAWLVLAVIGAVKAWNGEYWEVPVLHGFLRQYIG